ncbi:MAG TPA: hypothetical protein VK963_01945, partial [Candidatus Saccharimonadales bacterium]|nr:hypothetical protein [Candidatus Saccharimonadales bacterium]
MEPNSHPTAASASATAPAVGPAAASEKTSQWPAEAAAVLAQPGSVYTAPKINLLGHEEPSSDATPLPPPPPVLPAAPAIPQ